MRPQLTSIDERTATAGAMTASPCVLNLRQDRVGSRDLYIGRGSPWGNPFRIGRDGDRAAVLLRHERWLHDQHGLLRRIGELRDRNLVCFRVPLGCHGRLLLRLANGMRDELIGWWRGEAT
jgi:hypothetical protein